MPPKSAITGTTAAPAVRFLIEPGVAAVHAPDSSTSLRSVIGGSFLSLSTMRRNGGLPSSASLYASEKDSLVMAASYLANFLPR